MLKSGKANEKQKQELFNAGMQLAEEQKEKTDEEAEIRRILESAGVQVLSTEEWAKERLAYIRGRRAEIAAADQKTRVLEDPDGEYEILVADELELSAYLDAAAKAESGPPDDAESADDTDGTEEPPEEDGEDRVISVITKGLCPFPRRQSISGASAWRNSLLPAKEKLKSAGAKHVPAIWKPGNEKWKLSNTKTQHSIAVTAGKYLTISRWYRRQ